MDRADRRRWVRLALVLTLIGLIGVAWVTHQVSSADRYAREIAASGLTPYAPAGWTADDVGSWSDGQLRYRMHDHRGRHLAVVVRRATGDEHGLVGYQQTLLDQYGVVVSLRTDDASVRTVSATLPDEVGSELEPQDVDWLADRACGACRLAAHLVDSGVLFG